MIIWNVLDKIEQRNKMVNGHYHLLIGQLCNPISCFFNNSTQECGGSRSKIKRLFIRPKGAFVIVHDLGYAITKEYNIIWE